MWLTRDGGATWSELAAAGNDAWLIAAPAPGIAVLVRADGSAWRSSDHGASWSRASVPAATGYSPRALRLGFASPAFGWMVNPLGTLWRTTDGGLTWSASSLPIPASPSRVEFSTVVLDMVFATATQGWAVGPLSLVLRTDDGGQTWRQQAVPVAADQELRSVFALDGAPAWIPSSRGVLSTVWGGR